MGQVDGLPHFLKILIIFQISKRILGYGFNVVCKCVGSSVWLIRSSSENMNVFTAWAVSAACSINPDARK